MELQPTPKDLALRALHANQEHQYALAQHAEKLSAELADLDKLLTQADTEDGESDLECDFYIPDAKPPIGPIRNFLHPESPFYGDAMKRTRYLNFTVRHNMPPKEIEALKAAVNAEMRRVEQLEGASSTTTDTQMASKLNWSVIAEKVSDASSITRTAEECKIKWIGDLSPTVNRGPWSVPEVQSLQNILKKRSNQKPVNWEEVAKELGTNRLPIECMRQGLERPRHIWTAEADQKLVDAVRQYGMSWSLVAKYVAPDVTANQCASRYQRTLDPTLKRGVWSAEEDKRLIAAVVGYGKSWSEVSNVVPGRNNEQCRDRWTGNLDPAKISLKKDDWDEEKDSALLEAVKIMGKKWKAIALQVGRSANACRVRYDKLKNQDSPDSPVAGPSTRDEEEVTGIPSGHSTPKPRAKRNQPPVTVEPPSVPEPARPRPRPVAKGKKRAASDSEDAVPRKKRTIQQDAVDVPVLDTVDSSGVEAEGALPLSGAEPGADPTAGDTTPVRKGRRRIPQVSDLPCRRSARLKAGENDGETQGVD